MRTFFQEYHFKRKFAHFSFGIFLVVLMNSGLNQIFMLHFLVLTIIIGLILSIFIKYKKPKLLVYLLEQFEKPQDVKNFPGRGSIYFTIVALVSIALFSKEIASASILILTFGDPAAFIVGKYYGKKKLIVNKNKLLEGTIAGTFIGTALATLFVPFPIAFFGAAFGMMAEAIELKYLHFDDNFFIPFVSGLVMTLLTSLL